MDPVQFAELLERAVPHTGDLPLFFGYIDAGTGSMVFQWIAAAVVGGAFAIKLFWQNILSFFRRGPKDKSGDA